MDYITLFIGIGFFGVVLASTASLRRSVLNSRSSSEDLARRICKASEEFSQIAAGLDQVNARMNEVLDIAQQQPLRRSSKSA